VNGSKCGIICSARVNWQTSNSTTCNAVHIDAGITESSTDPPAIPLANQVGDAFGKRRSVGRCGGGSITAGCGRVMSILELSYYLIIDGEGKGGDEIESCS